MAETKKNEAFDGGKWWKITGETPEKCWVV